MVSGDGVEPPFQSTLLMRGATHLNKKNHPIKKFQSTLLMRGATSRLQVSFFCVDFNPRSSCEERLLSRIRQTNMMYFNPRSSCEERLPLYVSLPLHFIISIHAPHARSDSGHSSCNSRCQISIHAPHARSDLYPLDKGSWHRNFNPRSSCEERLHTSVTVFSIPYFNPRSSCEERHQ